MNAALALHHPRGPETARLRGICDLFAVYETALIRSRPVAAFAVKHVRGERTGGVPLGSSVGADGRLSADPAEAAAVARARELRAEGRSLREIAAALDAEGHRPRGKRWRVQTLERMVASASTFSKDTASDLVD